MIIVPFEGWHLAKLELQASQAESLGIMDHGDALERAGPAFTVVGRDSEIIACGGGAEWVTGTMEVWALLSETGPGRFLKIHRAVERFMILQDMRRYQTHVREDFARGHRWAKMLGFVQEGPPMQGFYEDGAAVRYARWR